MEPLLSVKNLCIDFATPQGLVRAVDKLSFDLSHGKTMGLVGESGSGKSVTSLALMQLLPYPGIISEGAIHFEGEDLLKLSDAQMRAKRGACISMIFQEPMTSLNPVMTVGAQIVEALLIHKKISLDDAKDQAIELLTLVKLPNPSGKFHAYPHEMSGGQKQRVMIAMALSCAPKLLICDEPTTALDVTIQKQILELLAELQQKLRMSMLFITHDLGVISHVADDLLVMYRSKIVEQGSKSQIFSHPNHPYTKGLLACRPKLGEEKRRLSTVADFLDPSSVTLASVPVMRVDPSPILQVRHVSVDYSIESSFFWKNQVFRAVDDVSFTLERGKTFGLVGESGCGKTTLGRTLMQLIKPVSGEVIFNNTNLVGLSKSLLHPFRKKMQMIFQDPYSSLNPRMTVEQILTEPLVIHEASLSSEEKKSRVLYLLKRVGLGEEHLRRYPHEFSGGQRQRICIARALVLKPEFIVCDESVSALDVSVQAQVLNLLLDLQDEFGLSYVFISHNLSVVNFMSDQVAVMNNGKIVEQSSSSELYLNPQNDYTKKLLSAIL